MPIQDHRTGTTGSCHCCGTVTRKSTGTALLPHHPAIVYFARWTPDCPGSLIAFLIGLGHPGGFVSVLYRFESNSFMVVGPGDYDWQSSVAILPRDRVIGMPLAKTVFQTLDEIWLHDPELIAFVQSAAKRG